MMNCLRENLWKKFSVHNKLQFPVCWEGSTTSRSGAALKGNVANCFGKTEEPLKCEFSHHFNGSFS